MKIERMRYVICLRKAACSKLTLFFIKYHPHEMGVSSWCNG